MGVALVEDARLSRSNSLFTVPEFHDSRAIAVGE